MGTLVRTELLKLRTTRTVPIVLGVAFVLSCLRAAQVFVNAGKVGAASLGTTAATRDLLLAPAVGSLVLLVVGVLAVSSETRYATIEWAFLQTPARGRVIAAKALAVAAVAVAYAVVATVLIAGVAALVMAQRGVALDAVNDQLVLALVGTLLGLPLHAILGVGIGALIRNQLAAVLVPLGWFVVVETLLPAYGLGRVVRWLPGGAVAALARSEAPGVLPMPVGAVLLVAYAGAALAAGIALTRRRDLT